MIKKTIVDFIKKNKHDWFRLRYYFHQNPERSMHEYNTTRKIKEFLVKYGFKIHTFEKSGVVGILKKGNSKKTIALRMPIDALNIVEDNEDLTYKSLNDYMHCSGNDGHIVMLLSVCQYFSEHNTFDGTLVVIFQPGKEKLNGSRYITNSDFFKSLKIDEIHTLHSITNNQIKHSKFGDFCLYDKRTAVLPSNDMIQYTITPKLDENNKKSDPILTLCSIIIQIQTILNNDLNFFEDAKITIGHICGGDIANTMATHASFKINIKTFDDDVRNKVINRVQSIVENFCNMNECDYEIVLIGSSPKIINNYELHERNKKIIIDTFGPDKIKIIKQLMITEDFGLYLNEIPGTIVFLNSGSDKDIYTNNFDFNDDILMYGIAYFISIVENYLCFPTNKK